MSKPVIIVNPQARAVRRGQISATALEAQLGSEVGVVAPETLDDLHESIRAITVSRAKWLGVVGGDGTLSRVLSSWSHHRPRHPLPAVVPFGGGTMNTVRRSLGVRQSVAQMSALVRRYTAGEQCLRPIVRYTLRVDDDRLGFLFGNGLFGTYIHEYDQGTPGPRRAATVLARAILATFSGGELHQRLSKMRVGRIEADGEVVAQRQWLTVAGGTVSQAGLGFRPFYLSDTNPGYIHVVAIGCKPTTLASRLLRAYRGQPLSHPEIEEFLAKQVIIYGSERQTFNLDGELGTTGPTTVLRVGPPVRFLVPRAVPKKR